MALLLFRRMFPGWQSNGGSEQSSPSTASTLKEKDKCKCQCGGNVPPPLTELELLFKPLPRVPLASSRSSFDRAAYLDLESQSRARYAPKDKTDTESTETGLFSFFQVDRRTISDAILGLSDGLTVPFALSAGLSSLGTTRVVILGGLAEMVAGAISMGLGGFLGARSELASYNTTMLNTRLQIENSPGEACALVKEVFAPYGLSRSAIRALTENLRSSPERFLGFLMTFHHQESFPTMKQAYKTAVTLAFSYFFGGLIPLIPYFIVERHEVMLALWWSIGIMAITLLLFGYTKTCIVVGWGGRSNVWQGTKGGLQMLAVGAAAVAAAIGLVKAIEQGDSFK